MLQRNSLALLAALFVSTPAASAQCPSDDAFEPNDSPAAAVTIAEGFHESLVVFGPLSASSGDDYFTVEDVPAAHAVVVEIFEPASNARVALAIEALGSGASVSNGFSGDRRLVLSNDSGAPQDFELWFSAPSADDACVRYDFRLEVVLDYCQLASDDALEDNEECAFAPALPAGTYPSLFLSPDDDDVFQVDVPAGHLLTVDQACDSSQAYVSISANANCTGVLDAAGGGTAGVRTARYENRGASTATVRVRNWILGDFCAPYDLSVTVAPAPCATAVDDAFEPNDDCASAAPVGPGLSNLLVSETNPDHYRVAVPTGAGLNVDVPFDASGATPDVRLYRGPSCASAVGEVANGSDTVTAEWFNDTGSTQDVVVAVTTRAGSGVACGVYSVFVHLTPDPCATAGGDDGFEDNDTCATAVALPEGVSTDLLVRRKDPDVFGVLLQAGERRWITVDATSLDTDLELYAFDEASACSDLANGWFARGTDTNSRRAEMLLWNWNADPQRFFVLLRVADDSAGECSRYDISNAPRNSWGVSAFCFGDGTARVAGGATVGCPCGNDVAPGTASGCAHGLGYGARLMTADHEIPAAGEWSAVRLRVRDGSPNAPAVLVQSAGAGASAFRDGVLCLGADMTRVESFTLDASGAATSASQLSTVGPITVGATRYYQVWYRDTATSPCGGGANLTNGVAIRWR